MDGSTTDRLARMLLGASRRRALQAALGGAAAATAGMAASGLGGDAQKKKRCKKRRCRARALGAGCETTLQCCPNETNRICAFASGMPGPKCCGVLGATCVSSNDCCSGFVCFDGQCAFAG
jgi:hypothetical protein